MNFRSCFLVLIVSFFSLSLSAQKIDLSKDLSGAWRMTYEKEGQKYQYDIVAIKSPLKLFDGSIFYSVTGNFAGMKLIGFSFVKIKNRDYIHWVRLASPNEDDLKGTRIDGEGNFVVNITDKYIGLGDDNIDPKNTEYLKMIKLPHLK